MTTKKTLGIAKILGLLGVTFLTTALGFKVLTAPPLGTTVQKLNSDLDELHDVLKEGYKVTLQARLTVDNVNKAAIDERMFFEKQVPPMMAQVQTILGNTNTLIVSANEATKSLTDDENAISDRTVDVLKSTNIAIIQLQPLLDKGQDSLQQVAATLADIDARVKSPEITDTLDNIDVATGHLSTAAGDVEHQVHNLVYPKPAVSVINWTLKIAHAAGSWFHF